MASIISASTTSSTALNLSGDTTGILQLATGATPTTAVTIDASQNVTLNNVIPSGSTVPTNGMFLPTTSTIGFSTASTERMRIDSIGSLIVGATATSSYFDGIANFAGRIHTKASVANYFWQTGAGSQTYLTFLSAGTPTQTGSISTNGTITVYNTTSDYRLKENVLPMVGALETIAQLKPVTYNWKVNGSDGQGFIAHELQAVVPDCVTGEKDAIDAEGNPQYQGIDTSFLVATLTSAIQEQQALITTLQTQITALNAKVGI